MLSVLPLLWLWDPSKRTAEPRLTWHFDLLIPCADSCFHRAFTSSFTASHVAIPSIQALVSQNFRNHFFLKSNSQCGKPSKAPGNCPKSIQIHWSYVNGKKSSRLQQLFCPHRAGRWLIKSGSHNGAVDFVDQWRIPEKDWMDGHYSADEWSK